MLVVRRLALTLALALPCVLAAPASAVVPAVVVGDSLAVGTKPFLGGLLPGYALSWDARNGWTTPQGMSALRAKLRVMQPRAVVVSLGTNDGPSPTRFADRMRRILAAIPAESCIVWPTIVRPARKGRADGLNRVLRRYAARDDRLELVDWDGAVRKGRVRLPDGLHPDSAGYERRSRMVVAALNRACGPAPAPAPAGDGSGGAVAPTG